ncbi:hypothetical protein DXG01_000260 [Tephrocybe rancida]|nr:hypothetical protein DXG01_000260 [Tephrocybe rancida]
MSRVRVTKNGGTSVSLDKIVKLSFTIMSSDSKKCHIQILPDELFITIFNASLSDDTEFPFVIASVSSRWRLIALNTSSLWTTIYARIPNAKTPTSNLLLLFERSGSQPLHITLHFPVLPFNSQPHRELSEAISKNAFRIRAIVARVESLGAFREFASPFNTLAFPLLTELDIDSNALPCFEHHSPLLIGATSLQSLVFPKCLTCSPIGPDLTRLEIRKLECNVDQFRTIFQASPHLHTLILYRLGNLDVDETPNLPPIFAPSLCTLSLTVDDNHVYDSTTCRCPMSTLVAPNLKRLEVYQMHKPNPEYFRFIDHFSDFPKLEFLKIVDFTLNQADGHLIQKWTTLAHLELFDTDHTCLWSTHNSNDGSDDATPWQNLVSVALTDPTIPGRSHMAEAIRKSCTQYPRTFTLKVDQSYHYCTAELHSDLPGANLAFFQRVFNTVFYDDDELDSDTDEGWSDESDDNFGMDMNDIDGIDYELDPESYYDDSDDDDDDDDYDDDDFGQDWL